MGELVIDGGTLSHILGTEMEQELAKVGAQCGSVVICRSSPSQKAAIVRMMSEYEMSQVMLLPALGRQRVLLSQPHMHMLAVCLPRTLWLFTKIGTNVQGLKGLTW